MFKARDGYVLVGSDFSQQEPRLLSNYAQDEDLITNYKNNKDLYALIGSKVYHNNYEDNLEFNPITGQRSEDGAKRRSICKQLLLAITYGMSPESLANKIHATVEEAQGIIDGFYNGFPKVKQWSDKTIKNAKITGYVEDWHGRRRRLPVLQLPEYEVTLKDGDKNSFNPFLWCENKILDETVINKYLNKLNKVKDKKDIQKVRDEANKEGLSITSNEYEIARNSRQCVNARIQGGAATMTKVAMIKLYHDQRLKELGFKLLIGVHDELIGECPKENADEVAERLTYIMKTCIADRCIVPFKCDAEISERWYGGVYQSTLQDEMNKMMKTMTKEEAFEKLVEEHTENPRETLLQLIS